MLFDLDGVFYVGNQCFPGAISTLNFLGDRQILWRFITNTNTNTKSRQTLHQKLLDLGLPIPADQSCYSYSSGNHLFSHRSNLDKAGSESSKISL
jgi:ribonucleotide monophosphatase NagD (HAD superfamily)